MKSEELFEALTDIDEELIYKAKAEQIKQEQAEDEYAQPLHITITKKKFPWRAACAAMAVVIAASAGGAVLRNKNIVFPSQQDSANDTNIVLNSVNYPEDAKYIYQGDFSELKVEKVVKTGIEVFNIYDMLERRSDLVVYGTFTDDAHQNFDPTYSYFNDPLYNINSYNKFRIDKIIKGNNTVNEGDEIIICQYYAVSGDTLWTYSGLTPMIKGDRWFYFLTKNGDSDIYYPTGDTDGRYYCLDDIVPSDNEYQYIPLTDNNLGVYNADNYKYNIHSIIIDRHFRNFEPYINNVINYLYSSYDGNKYSSPETFEIANPPDDNNMYDRTQTFEMAEFPGVYFIWSAYEVKAVKGDEEFTLYSGWPVWDLWLADINGDGKREICSTVSMGFGMIDEEVMVFDYENGDLYNLSDRGNYDFTIHYGLNGILYYAKKEYNGEKIVYEPFSFTAMKKINTSDTQNEATFVQQQADETGETNIKDKDSAAIREHFKIYEQFGLIDEGEKKGLYYNGKKVRWFEDYYPIDEDGNQAGWDYINEEGIVDVYAVRDFSELTYNPDGSFDPSGKLIGLKEFSEEEFNARDINAIMTDKEVTHVIIASDDSIAINSDSNDYMSTSEDSTAVETSSDIENAVAVANEDAIAVGKSDLAIEATYNSPMSEEDLLKEREETLKLAEEYKPFGVTYDQTADEWYFNGEKVRYFRDIFYSNGESLTGGKFSGTMRSLYGNGTVDIYTVRDYSRLDEDGKGKLLDIKAFENGEFNPDAVLNES